MNFPDRLAARSRRAALMGSTRQELSVGLVGGRPHHVSQPTGFRASVVINGIPYSATGPTAERVLGVMAEVKARVLAKDGQITVSGESLTRL